MSQTDVQDKVMKYLRENFLYLFARGSVDLEVSTVLLEEGIIDSKGVIEIVNFFKSDFGVTVADEEFTEGNCGLPRAITDLVGRKSPTAAG